jgi:c-di-GMP-binding flagellar brake protein YcgR
MKEERRSASRRELRFPIKVVIPAPAGATWFNATVRDISASGVYFLGEKVLDIDTQVRLMIDFAVDFTGGVNVLIDALAKVVRVENRHERGEVRIGVAAAITRFEVARRE